MRKPNHIKAEMPQRFRTRVLGCSMMPAFGDGAIVEFARIEPATIRRGMCVLLKLADGVQTWKRVVRVSRDALIIQGSNSVAFPQRWRVKRSEVVAAARAAGLWTPIDGKVDADDFGIRPYKPKMAAEVNAEIAVNLRDSRGIVACAVRLGLKLIAGGKVPPLSEFDILLAMLRTGAAASTLRKYARITMEALNRARQRLKVRMPSHYVVDRAGRELVAA